MVRLAEIVVTGPHGNATYDVQSRLGRLIAWLIANERMVNGSSACQIQVDCADRDMRAHIRHSGKIPDPRV